MHEESLISAFHRREIWGAVCKWGVSVAPGVTHNFWVALCTQNPRFKPSDIGLIYHLKDYLVILDRYTIWRTILWYWTGIQSEGLSCDTGQVYHLEDYLPILESYTIWRFILWYWIGIPSEGLSCDTGQVYHLKDYLVVVDRNTFWRTILWYWTGISSEGLSCDTVQAYRLKDYLVILDRHTIWRTILLIKCLLFYRNAVKFISMYYYTNQRNFPEQIKHKAITHVFFDIICSLTYFKFNLF